MAKDKGAKKLRKVAGVKVPKGLRKVGEVAADMAQQPVVGEFVAAALTAAAASLMADDKTRKAVTRGTANVGADTVKQASAVGAAVKKVLLEAAREMLESFEGSPQVKTLARSARAKPKRKKKA